MFTVHKTVDPQVLLDLSALVILLLPLIMLLNPFAFSQMSQNILSYLLFGAIPCTCRSPSLTASITLFFHPTLLLLCWLLRYPGLQYPFFNS
jgi:hypothetical protein